MFYELFCLESIILSFPKVVQIPPESPCIWTEVIWVMIGPSVICFDMRIKFHFLHNADKFVPNRAIKVFSRILFHGVSYVLLTQPNFNQTPEPSVRNLPDSGTVETRQCVSALHSWS